MMNAQSLASVSLRKLPLQKRSRKTVQKIANTTALLLEEIGIEALSMRMIASKCEMSVGGVYEYFPNKIDVLSYIADQSLVELRTHLKSASADRHDYSNAIAWSDAIIDFTFEWYSGKTGIVQLLFICTITPELRQIEFEHDQWILDWLSRNLSSFGAKGDRLEIIATSRVIQDSIHMSCMSMVLKGDDDLSGAMLRKLKFSVASLILSLIR